MAIRRIPLVLARVVFPGGGPGNAVPRAGMAGPGADRFLHSAAGSGGFPLRDSQHHFAACWRRDCRPDRPQAAPYTDAGRRRRAYRCDGAADRRGCGHPLARVPGRGAAGSASGPEPAGPRDVASRHRGAVSPVGCHSPVQCGSAHRADHRPAPGRSAHRRAAVDRPAFRCVGPGRRPRRERRLLFPQRAVPSPHQGLVQGRVRVPGAAGPQFHQRLLRHKEQPGIADRDCAGLPPSGDSGCPTCR